MFVTLHTNVIVVTIRISIADLIGGGGNTDVCPGRKTPSRRLWGYFYGGRKGGKGGERRRKGRGRESLKVDMSRLNSGCTFVKAPVGRARRAADCRQQLPRLD